MLIWTRYRYSLLATMLSMLGWLVFLCGLYFSMDSTGDMTMFPLGLLLMIASLLIVVYARKLGKRKNFEAWEKKLRDNGYYALIRESDSVALDIYSINPCKETLAYIEFLNPRAARQIVAIQQADKKFFKRRCKELMKK